MPDRLVILGGTFDPVHFAHLIVARSVAEHLAAERIVLMPAAVPPHKGPPAVPARHRLAMLTLAVEDDKLFEVSDLELARTGPSYTYDTLMRCRDSYGNDVELVWVIGLDMLEDLPNWYRASEVVDLARIVTAVRPPMPEKNLDAYLSPLLERFSREQVARLAAGVIQSPLVEISSTQIRRRLRAGLSVRYLTPDAVIDYIHQHDLYRSQTGQ
ncbi:MAG: nicotinate (nicotinamide) nucleotide adenylyltransferase [Planctomycetes bacterium]|nr:nicotinate (nicotinamide) nucleotide adenylyltransferase [Planctomycetota bacterium]